MPIPHLALLFLFLWVTVFEPELICLLSLHHWRCSLQWGSCLWLRAMPVRFTAVNPRQLGDGCIGPDSGSVCQATVSSTLGYLAHFKVERLWQIGFTGASWLSSSWQMVAYTFHSMTHKADGSLSCYMHTHTRTNTCWMKDNFFNINICLFQTRRKETM